MTLVVFTDLKTCNHDMLRRADGNLVVQCTVDFTSTPRVVLLGESVALPVGDDCFECGPCTENGMTCYQMFRFVQSIYIYAVNFLVSLCRRMLLSVDNEFIAQYPSWEVSVLSVCRRAAYHRQDDMFRAQCNAPQRASDVNEP